MLDLTISIVNYHNEEDIRTMVATIEQYTPREITKKIYLIDNGDSTALTEIAKPYGDVTVIKSPGNIGFGRGHNQVLAQQVSRDRESGYRADRGRFYPVDPIYGYASSDRYDDSTDPR